MVAYNKFNDFVEQIGLKIHNLNVDQLKVYLSNELPLATDTIKTDVAEITAVNGYPAGGSDILNVWAENPAGTGEMTGTDVVFTASGGSFGPFQYVVMYNEDTAAPLNALIGWWDYGSAISINDTETFTVNFGANILTIV
jgi:hypothetical protein